MAPTGQSCTVVSLPAATWQYPRAGRRRAVPSRPGPRRDKELRVTLDWGTDEETGRQWLRMTNNGVGMTEAVIKNYFTQIGKSFY